jgi:aldehyde:ferredoxin oxidoreductase
VELDAPSSRYGSTPSEGPAAGKNIMAHWDEMLRNYYDHMGWDRKTGKPLPETLTSLGLGDIVSDIW